jgi:ParB-like chromosome segregation protein Spo0J
MKTLTIRELPISDCRPAAYNPRKPLTTKARQKLKASLESFGLVEPLIWNERTQHIVGGHARLSLLKEMGWETIPVSVVSLSDEQERSLNVVLNNAEAQGRFDRQLLKALLEPLQELPEFELTGFDSSIMANLDYMENTLGDNLENPRDTIEVTLVIPRDQFSVIQPRLDQLIREFDLVSHRV